jgi:hypothetical protein
LHLCILYSRANSIDSEPRTQNGLLIHLRDLKDEGAVSEFREIYVPLVQRPLYRVYSRWEDPLTAVAVPRLSD